MNGAHTMNDSVEIIIQNMEVRKERMTHAWYLIGKALKAGTVVVTLGRSSSKSREQERKYHAMIREIHRGAFRGNTFEGVKALMVAEFADELKSQGKELTHPGETIYSHKLKAWVTVRPSTKKFRKAEAAAFIEFLYALGCELGVQWSEKATEIADVYRQWMEEQRQKEREKKRLSLVERRTAA